MQLDDSIIFHNVVTNDWKLNEYDNSFGLGESETTKHHYYHIHDCTEM